MTRVGSKKKPYFRLVVMEGRTALQSSFVENLGTYNPRMKPAQVQINKERVEHWLQKGAKPSSTVRTLLKRHLSRDLSVPVEPPAAPPAQ
jgi:small subunit ribosomal protein S16